MLFRSEGVSAPIKVYDNLLPNTEYHVRVKARCYLLWESVYSDTQTFQTLPEPEPEDTVGVANYKVAVSLYPNPTTGILTLQDSREPLRRIVIYDIYGNVLQTKEVDANQVELDVSHLAAGLYMIRVETEKGMAVRRFVKR